MINTKPRSSLNQTGPAAGFALPTILIVALVMLSVLVMAASSLSEIRTALNAQYYNKLASEAAESGAARAAACLQDNGFIAQWSSSSLLRPNTNCSGGSACSNNSDCFVVSTDNLRATFVVEPPEDEAVSQSVKSIGKVELLRASTGAVWKTYTQSIKTRVGIDVSFNKVTFGYSQYGSGGAFFFTIGSDGRARATGYNANGQLGTGNRTNILTPSLVSLPGGVQPASIYANFVSQGRNSFILAQDGQVYGSGENSNRELGDGTSIDRTTMVRYRLPDGVTAKHVAPLGTATYVVTTDNNIYSSGSTSNGKLGSGIIFVGGNNMPKRVLLPTPTSNLNTIPTNDIVTDSDSAIVRMEGGAVYGWGKNDRGQLAQGGNDYSNRWIPVKIGSFGDSSQPKAVDLAFDGDSLYVVGDNGTLYSSGRNHFGQLGKERNPIANRSSQRCIENQNNSSGNGNPIILANCDGSSKQDWKFTDDGLIININTGKCLDDASTADNNGTMVHLWTCGAAGASQNQRWEMDNSGRFINIDSGKCLDVSGDDVSAGNRLDIWTCGPNLHQRWEFANQNSLSPVDIPSSAGDVVKVETDQWFASALTDSGQVWSFGTNESGSFGTGTTSRIQMEPQQFELPSGVKAVDITVSATNIGDGYSNLLVIGDNGRVYGAGNNGDGQLGVYSQSTRRPTPVAMQVIDGTNIKARHALVGYGTSVILTVDGRIYTVGNNNSGQLGDGTTNSSTVPRANRYTNVLPITTY